MKPLRKIIERVVEYEKFGQSTMAHPRFYEILECGHKVRQKTDIYGPTNAYRRRCRQCGELEDIRNQVGM